MKRSEMLASALTLVAQMGFVGWFFCLSYINNSFTSMQVSYLPLTLAVLAVYLVDYFLLGRGLSVAVYVVVQTLFAAGGLWLWTRLVAVEPHRTWTVIFTGLIYVIELVTASYFAYEPVKERGAAIRFDFLVFATMFLIFLRGFMTIPVQEPTTVMCIVSVVCSVLSLLCVTASRRGSGGTVQGSPLAGKLFAGGALAAVIAVSALVSVFFMRALQGVSGAAAAVLRWCGEAVMAVLTSIYRALNAFLKWLASFSDPVPVEPAAGEAAPPADMVIDYSEMQVELPAYIYVIAVVIAAALFAFIVWRLRKLRVSKLGGRRMALRRAKRESSAQGELLRLLASLRRTLRYFVRRVRYRRTPAGLLDYCIRRAGKHTPRRTDESGESYLRRLAESGYSEKMSAALRSLAASVELSFYSRGDAPAPEGVYKTIHSSGSWKKEPAPQAR